MLILLLRFVPNSRGNFPPVASLQELSPVDDHQNYIRQRYYQSQYVVHPQVKKHAPVLVATHESPRDKSAYTTDAQPINSPPPKLTLEQKKRALESKMRLWVTVKPDGSHTEELIQSSGNQAIDTLVLATMKRWSWKPGIKNGIKMRQTITFRYLP